jgi:hypothetical protein
VVQVCPFFQFFNSFNHHFQYQPLDGGDDLSVTTLRKLSPTSRWAPHDGNPLTTVSAGHGLHYNNIGKWSERETPLNMNRAIFNHLDSLFPAPGGQVIGEVGVNGKNGFVNGAQGGTGEFNFYLEVSS